MRWQRYRRPLLLLYLAATIVALVAGLLQPSFDAHAWVRDPETLPFLAGPAQMTLLVIGAGSIALMLAIGIHALVRRQNLSKSKWYLELFVLYGCCLSLFLWHMWAAIADTGTFVAPVFRGTPYYPLFEDEASSFAHYATVFLIFGLICTVLCLLGPIVELWPSKASNAAPADLPPMET